MSTLDERHRLESIALARHHLAERGETTVEQVLTRHREEVAALKARHELELAIIMELGENPTSQEVAQ